MSNKKINDMKKLFYLSMIVFAFVIAIMVSWSIGKQQSHEYTFPNGATNQFNDSINLILKQ